MKLFNSVLAVAVVALAVGCSTTPQVLERVGPEPRGASIPSNQGRLVVATATKVHHEGDTTDYYLHTPYHIYAESGKLLKYVPNHVGHMDESPAHVTMPPGNYRVHALSDFGPVVVPIVIEPGKETVVNLQSAEAKMSRTTDDKSVVWMPAGHSTAYYEVGPKGPDIQ